MYSGILTTLLANEGFRKPNVIWVQALLRLQTLRQHDDREILSPRPKAESGTARLSSGVAQMQYLVIINMKRCQMFTMFGV